ncbi:hypothetical protein F4805DRAFT_478791 [Annulohypoxylon moriforme]|nr:hypothetical protein F4805DRAFT_478791 [Annulohypoxylon moriforme]
MNPLAPVGGNPRDEDQVGRPPPPRGTPARTSFSRYGFVACDVCKEEFLPNFVTRLACSHFHCQVCLRENAHNAYLTKPFAPARCCMVIPNDVFMTLGVFSTREMSVYSNMAEEYTTPGVKLYCHDRDCNAFIPRSEYTQRTAKCQRCHKNTCKTCAQKSHFGVCDPAHLNVPASNDPLFKLAADQGWRQCPNCLTLVEHEDGCTHMTCICGQKFCYLCGLSLGDQPFDHDRFECTKSGGRPVID